jgi:hypothetical protein
MSRPPENPWLKLDARRRPPSAETGEASVTEQSKPPASKERRGRPHLRQLNRKRAIETVQTAEPDPAVALRSRSVVGAGYVGRDLRRPERRQRQRAADDRQRAHRTVVTRERKAAVDAERQARKDANYLPARGERRPEAGRSLWRLKVAPHRATTDTLSVAYPFLAEAGLGSEGTLIGHDSWSGAEFCFDVWNLYRRQVVTNPNMVLAGIVGRGKSALAKSLATRSIAFGRKVYVPGDPKGEWTVVARAVGGASIALGPGMTTRINPLDEGPRPAYWVDPEGVRQVMRNEMWRSVVTNRRRDLMRALTEQALGRDLQSVEMTALFAALEVAVGSHETPILPHVVHEMMYPSGETEGSSIQQLTDDGRAAAHALKRVVGGDLAGLFDGESTTRFDASLPMLTVDMSRMYGNDTLIALAMTCASAWMEGALNDPDGGQRLVVYDEAWRLIRLVALLARMQSQWKLSRYFGIANLMVIHRLSDLDAVGDADSAARNLALGLLADTSTRIVYGQERDQAGSTGATLGLSQAEIAQLPDLLRGEGLWRIGERAFVVSHELTAGEAKLYDTDARMTTDGGRGSAAAVTDDDGSESDAI